jgi:protein O-GlcNAc transferase
MNHKERRAAAKPGQTTPSRPLGGPSTAIAAGLLSVGFDHHRAGRLAEAEIWYRRVLAAEPNHADALHLLGVIAHEFGRRDLAVKLIRQAIQQNGKPDYFFSLGNVFHSHGKLNEAVSAYRQAIRIKLDFAAAYCNFGIALTERGSLDEAIAACRQAIRIKPNLAEAHYNLGNALKKRGSIEEAVSAYRQAIVRLQHP